MRNKTILILGGSGFIGTNLLDYYGNKPEYKVRTTEHKTPLKSKSNFLYFGLSLTNEKRLKDLFDLTEPDIIIQAAAVTSGSKDIISKPWIHTTDNAIMNSLIFREAYLRKVKHVIFLSCSTMYPSRDYNQKETDWNKNGEEIPPQYFGVAHTKLYAEKMCEFYAGLGDTKFTVLRHSNIIGPHDKFDLEKSHFVGAMINKICNLDEIEILGDGSAKRDILYIDDLIDCIDKSIQNQEDKFQIFNCGYEHAFSIKDIIDYIQGFNQSNKPVKYNYTQKSISTQVSLDCSKAKKLIGWERETTLMQGLEKTLEWYKKNNA